MIISHQKSILIQIMLNTLTLHFFLLPMCQPSRIDLSSKDHSPWFHRFNIVILKLGVKVIQTNICTLPMTFSYVNDPINIIQSTMNIKILPHFPQSINVCLISSHKSILILNLQHRYAAFLILHSFYVTSDNICNCFEINFSLFQEQFIAASDGKSINRKKTSRHSSEIPFCTYIGTRPDENSHIMLLRQLQKQGQVFVLCLKIEFPFLDLMVIPHYIHTKCIQSHCFDHFDSVLPILHRYP